MNIVFSNHAKYRINERKISVFSIRQTIKNPSSKRIDEYGMIIVRKNFSKKLLEVVYKLHKSDIFIITAYYAN